MNVKKTIKLARELTLFVVSIVTHMYTCTHVEGENCVGTTCNGLYTVYQDAPTFTLSLSHLGSSLFNFDCLCRRAGQIVGFAFVNLFQKVIDVQHGCDGGYFDQMHSLHRQSVVAVQWVPPTLTLSVLSLLSLLLAHTHGHNGIVWVVVYVVVEKNLVHVLLGPCHKQWFACRRRIMVLFPPCIVVRARHAADGPVALKDARYVLFMGEDHCVLPVAAGCGLLFRQLKRPLFSVVLSLPGVVFARCHLFHNGVESRQMFAFRISFQCLDHIVHVRTKSTDHNGERTVPSFQFGNGVKKSWQ